MLLTSIFSFFPQCFQTNQGQISAFAPLLFHYMLILSNWIRQKFCCVVRVKNINPIEDQSQIIYKETYMTMMLGLVHHFDNTV